jgi:hypothetical protein
VGRQTDGVTDMTTLIAVLRNFENAPKNWKFCSWHSSSDMRIKPIFVKIGLTVQTLRSDTTLLS